jgi:hypothetical protein
MPIRFQGQSGAYPNDAFFADLPTLDSVIASLPGLRGAWDASDYSGSGPWLPRVGSSFCINPAISGTTPTRAERNGRPVLRIVPTGRAWIQMADTSAMPNLTGLTFASRAYYSNTTTNFQKLLDMGAPELYFRSTLATPVWQFAGLGTAGSMPIAAPTVGWHSILFRKQGIAAALFSADGSGEVAFGSEGQALNSSLQLGDASNATSAEHDISRVIICDTGALTVGQIAAVRTWING